MVKSDYYLHVRLSVRMKQFDSDWKDFDEIWYPREFFDCKALVIFSVSLVEVFIELPLQLCYMRWNALCHILQRCGFLLIVGRTVGEVSRCKRNLVIYKMS
jgi:hypothetical protein